MAHLQNNLYLQGASGMLGKQLVYKTVNGNLIVSSRPTRRNALAEVTIKQNMRFRKASHYAKSALADDSLAPIYIAAASQLSRYNSPYQLALADYMKSPEIGDIEYQSTVRGSSVLIEAFEDPKLARVSVSILSNNHTVIESGEAVETDNGIQWEYILPIDIPEGGKIEVKAYDLPGNITTKTFE